MNIKEQIADDYINGNLTDAKKRARRLTGLALMQHFQDHCGYSADTAAKIAAYLKGVGSFQAACDAEHAEKHS